MADRVAILDTGAVVAFLSRNDRHHHWAVTAFKKLPPVLVTCEAVLSELFFLLRADQRAIESASNLLKQRIIKVLPLHDELERLLELITKYRGVPMSYADAALVRIAELTPSSTIVTTDSDFRTYRLHRTQKIPLITVG